VVDRRDTFGSLSNLGGDYPRRDLPVLHFRACAGANHVWVSAVSEEEEVRLFNNDHFAITQSLEGNLIFLTEFNFFVNVC